MKLLIALMLVPFLGCGVQHKAKVVPASAIVDNNLPRCLDWEHPTLEGGKILCKPDWQDEVIDHAPACIWLPTDEICTNSI